MWWIMFCYLIIVIPIIIVFVIEKEDKQQPTSRLPTLNFQNKVYMEQK